MAEYGDNILDYFKPHPESENRTLQNLYAQGYLGVPVDQVRDERTPFGAMLEKIGILGEVDPRSMTPLEAYTYQQGKSAKQDREFQVRTKGAEEEFTKKKRKVTSLADILDIANATKKPPEELLADTPDAADDVNALLERIQREELEGRTDRRLKQDLLRAQIRRLMEGGGGRGKDPLDVMQARVNKLMGSVGGRQNLKSYAEYVQRAEQLKTSNPNESKRLLERALDIKNRMKASGQMYGIPPEIIDLELGQFDPLSVYQREPDPNLVINNKEELDAARERLLQPRGESLFKMGW